MVASLSAWCVLAAPGRALQASDQSLALVISGASDHHWEFSSAELAELLRASGKFQVDSTSEPAALLARPEGLGGYDVLVLDYNGPRWGAAAEEAFLEAVRAGAGVVVVHAADAAFPDWPEYAELVGHVWRAGESGQERVRPLDVAIVDREHPVTRGLADIPGHPDELRHGLVAVPGTAHRVLAEADSSPAAGGSGRREPVVMAGAYGSGRVFHTTLGHVWRGSQASRDSYRDPRLRDLLVRGAEWAATGEVRVQAAAPNALSEAERALGWELLFDGATGAGWRGFRQEGFPEGWEVRDGCLVVAGGSGVDLISERAFGDFELDLEFQLAERANSGIMVRVTEDAEATWHTGPELQLLDDAALGELPDLKHSVGALYDLAAPAAKVVRPIGEWNRARIALSGWKLELYLNGFPTVSMDLGSPEGRRAIAASKFAGMPGFAAAERGHVALQDHGDRVRFRSIKLLDRSTPRGEPLFDGNGTDGWLEYAESGAAGGAWRAEDGMLVTSGTPSGYLITAADFGDFILRFQWRWNPASEVKNGGVLLRARGADELWPRSLQLELESGSAGDLWTVGGFELAPTPGRTLGRHTRAARNNERELGRWNDCALVVEGADVSVWINGELVNCASGASPEPGRIALLSEGGEIAFRGLYLERL
jgi:type 1 glutamine amidotransferase